MTASRGIYRKRRPRRLTGLEEVVAWEMDQAARRGECLESALRPGGHGYPQTRFEGRPQPIHQMVCQHFYGERPNGMETRHLCGNKLCINPEHLRYGTSRENHMDTVRHGTMGRRKLTALQVVLARALVWRGNAITKLARIADMEWSNMADAIRGRTYAWVNFPCPPARMVDQSWRQVPPKATQHLADAANGK